MSVGYGRVRGMSTDRSKAGADLDAVTARRIALAAQGFTDPRPTGRIDARHIRRVFRRLGFVQLDALDVLCRMHYATMFARLGSYPREVFDRMAWGTRPELFEYWGSQASLQPVSLHPLLRWRMARPDPPSWTPPNERRLAALPHGFVDRVLSMVEEHGPVSARALTPEEQRVRRRGMFDFSDTKFALEWLFHTGRVTVAARPNFTRVYDLTERVLPAEVLASPTPTQDDAQRELVRIAARSFGIASASDLRHFWLLRKDEAHARLLELVDSGELLRVRVEGWRVPAYLWHQAMVPRRVRARALLSPFDTLLGGRVRGPRLFDFDHRVEFYIPERQRVYGCFVLPFLLGERPVGRVDVKADRAGGRLLVRAAYAEADVDHDEVATELAAELDGLTGWLGLDRTTIVDRGNLAPALRRRYR